MQARHSIHLPSSKAISRVAVSAICSAAVGQCVRQWPDRFTATGLVDLNDPDPPARLRELTEATGIEAKARISVAFLRRKMEEYEQLKEEIEQLKIEVNGD